MGLGLDGQTALVTGGAKGIGASIVKRLIREGCRVIIWDKEFHATEHSGARNDRLTKQTVDVSDLAAVESVIEENVRAGNQFDIVVNNAGINGPTLPTWEYPVKDWQRVLDIDLNSVFYVCRTVLPHMINRGYGRIVNIASISGKEGNANGCAYAAAKAGVIAYTKSVAKETAGTGVLINCVAPSIADTSLLKEMSEDFILAARAKVPMGRFVEGSEIAAMVAWIASSECSFTTGFVFDITGGRATY